LYQRETSIFVFLVAALVLGLAVMLVGCSDQEPPKAQAGQVASQATQNDNSGLMLLFQDQETDIDPYVTRMLISDRFVRMDDGADSSDFLLFDRKENTVYSVAHSTHSILVIHGKPVTVKSPIPLKLDMRKKKELNAPAIGGKEPEHYTFLVNGKSCKDMIVVPGLLDSGLAALREFRLVMAGQHAENLPKTPVDMLDPCFLAHHIFSPVRDLKYGFPVQEWDSQGTSRSLMDYDQHFKIDPKLFELPDGYRRDTVGPSGVATDA
jgi:hypothetical protein